MIFVKASAQKLFFLIRERDRENGGAGIAKRASGTVPERFTYLPASAAAAAALRPTNAALSAARRIERIARCDRHSVRRSTAAPRMSGECVEYFLTRV